MQQERDIIIKNKIKAAAALTAAVLLVSSCAQAGTVQQVQEPSGTVSEEKLEIRELEATDTAVFLEYKERTGDVRLMSVDNGRTYTVSVNNMTMYEDNHGKVTVPELFETGMIVDSDISIHSRTLKSLKQDPEAFTRRDVTGFDININRGIFSLDDGTNLRITENTAVFKNDKPVKAADISDDDVLLLRGIEPDLYSICIMSGYGHLRVKGGQFFEGGWVQVAGMYKPVSEDMLLDVPEGEYDLVVSYKGRGGTKHVNVKRGQETTVDVSDLKGDLIKTGEIIFTIRPLEAEPEVKIDGKKVNYLEPVTLEYGVYQLEVSAEGYAKIKEHIAVGAEVANIEIELTEGEGKKSASSNKASSSSSSSTAKPATASTNNLPTTLSGNTGYGSSTSSSTFWNTSSTSSSSSSSTSSSSSSVQTGTGSSIIQGSRIYIDAPETAEVYFDGIYKGIVPCSFVKESGTHVITLRKDGYETRTFTVTIDTSTENETYSFSALQEEY